MIIKDKYTFIEKGMINPSIIPSPDGIVSFHIRLASTARNSISLLIKRAYYSRRLNRLPMNKQVAWRDEEMLWESIVSLAKIL